MHIHFHFKFLYCYNLVFIKWRFLVKVTKKTSIITIADDGEGNVTLRTVGAHFLRQVRPVGQLVGNPRVKLDRKFESTNHRTMSQMLNVTT